LREVDFNIFLINLPGIDLLIRKKRYFGTKERRRLAALAGIKTLSLSKTGKLGRQQ